MVQVLGPRIILKTDVDCSKESDYNTILRADFGLANSRQKMYLTEIPIGFLRAQGSSHIF